MKNIYLYQVIKFFMAIAIGLILPTYIPYLLILGLSKSGIIALQVCFTISCCVFDIPTGIIADNWGKKRCVMISCLVIAVSFFIYSLADRWTTCLIAEILLACGFSFSNGALQAWVLNSSPLLIKEKLGRFFAIEQIVDCAGKIAGGFIGVWVYGFTPSNIWLLGGILFSLYSVIITLILQEKVGKIDSSFSGKISILRQELRSAWSFMAVNKPFRFCLIMTGVHLLSTQAPNQYWQMIFVRHYTENLLGWAFACLTISMLLGTFISGYLMQSRINAKSAIIVCQLSLGVFIALTVATDILPLVIWSFLFHEVARGAFRTIKDAYLNQNIPSEMRATLVSANSTLGNIGTLLGQGICCVTTYLLSIETSWILSASILILTTIIVKNGKKTKG